MQTKSLVLYKQSPALVLSIADKLEILLQGGKTRSVREKDVVLLHPGPADTLPDPAQPIPDAQPQEAWELLQGESPTFRELAELVYNEFTPRSAWQTFLLLNRSPWFLGTPQNITVADAESVNARIQAEREKKEADARWDDFLNRFREGRADPDADEFFLRDLEMYALGRSRGSRILKTLGRTQSPENAHRLILEKHIKTRFWNPHPLRLDVPLKAPEVELEDFPPGEERLDLTGTEAFAIDDEGNQDPDDAVAWDGRRFWVHVADAAALAPPGSAADAAARERSSSLYLPECTVPMLPRQAARRLGLGLEPTSPALSYAFEIDDEYHVSGFSVHLTTVRVTRMTYAEAEQKISEEPFATINRITAAFRDRRYENGAVSINMPEVKVRVSEDTISITDLPGTRSRDMVAESMLMAGAYAGQWCLEQKIPVPFAVQDSPGGQSEQSQQKTAGHEAPLRFSDEFNKRKGMKRSRLTMKPSVHGGLGLDVYTRVTSPLRRYPDLLTSQQIRAYILGHPVQEESEVLAAVLSGDPVNVSLIQAERRSVMFWKIVWLSERPGWTCRAVLLELRERQGFFLIPEIALEIRVPVKKTLRPEDRVILKLKETDIAEPSAVFVIQEVLD